MKILSKPGALRSLLCLVLLSSALAAGAGAFVAAHHEPEVPEGVLQPEPAARPICLPGDKLVCTLGPPPVCRCE
jgi:hypothetical protein